MCRKLVHSGLQFSVSTGNMSPPKPWERMQSSAGLSPFKPPAPGRTADVVAASGTAKPGVPVAQWNPVMNGNPAGRPQPSRAWEQNRNNCEYGTNMNYNPGYGPPSPPSFWISVLRVVRMLLYVLLDDTVVFDFIGRIYQNSYAFQMFMSGLLQLARFVFRLLGIRTKPSKFIQPGPQGALPGLNAQGNNSFGAPKFNFNYKALESVWENNTKRS
ncbi:hypothetical protein AMTRI_Chr01g134540 [Amborella trichopoda]